MRMATIAALVCYVGIVITFIASLFCNVQIAGTNNLERLVWLLNTSFWINLVNGFFWICLAGLVVFVLFLEDKT